jgi:polar amino acid transport system substrate-binding protein
MPLSSILSGPAKAQGSALETAKAAKALTIGFANEKPFSYVDPSGKVTGAMVEVLRAALEPYGIVNLQPVIADFGALIPGLAAKRFDIIGEGMYITRKRCEQIAFSNPLSQAGAAIATKKGNPKSIHSLADVVRDNSIKIGTQIGSTNVDDIKQAGVAADQLVLFTKDVDVLAGLQAGRIDVMYFPDLAINALLSTSNDPGLERVKEYQPPRKADGKPALNYVGLGFRKEDGDLLAAFNDQLRAMRGSGKLIEIMAPFGFTQNEVPPEEVTATGLCTA